MPRRRSGHAGWSDTLSGRSDAGFIDRSRAFALRRLVYAMPLDYFASGEGNDSGMTPTTIDLRLTSDSFAKQAAPKAAGRSCETSP